MLYLFLWHSTKIVIFFVFSFPDGAGFAVHRPVALHFTMSWTSDGKLSADTVFCRVFLGLPTGAVPFRTNSVRASAQSTHHRFVLCDHATSVCFFSSHSRLPLYLVVSAVQCRTVFFQGNTTHLPDHPHLLSISHSSSALVSHVSHLQIYLLLL